MRQETTQAPFRLRARLIICILVAQAVLIGWTSDSEIARSIYLICYSLMMPTVLFLLLARLVGRLLPLDWRELLVAYVVLTATIPIIGFGGLRFLIPGMGFAQHFSQAQPQWARYVPAAAQLPVLQDGAAISDLYKGGAAVPWLAWTVPILFWSAYLLVLAAIWIGLAILLHRLWIREERLAFPITVLPVQLADPKDDLLRRPVFWIGFAGPFVLQSLLALREWFPTLPAVQMKATNYAPLIFTSPPWNSIPDLQVGLYPMAVGLAYFVPAGISFSCWFFMLLNRLSYAGAAAMGVEAAGTGAARFPYREEQAAGAWIALALILAFAARKSFRSNPQFLPGPPRRILAGTLALAVFGAGLMTWAGTPPLMAILVIGIYICYVVSGARVRAEAGSLWTFAPLTWTANRTAIGILGSAGLTNQAMLSTGHFDLVHVDIRGQSLPFLMEGLKISEGLGVSWRTLAKLVAAFTLTALALGWWFSLRYFYSLGAATADSNLYAMLKVEIGMKQMDSLAAARSGADWSGLGAMGLAGAATIWLNAMRARFTLFPFHPVGYVLCNTLTVNAFFVPIFAAWLAKAVAQRFGARVYRRSIPFFVGLVLGDVVVQAIWALIGGVFSVPVYQFLS
jgi:hypothetical protein